MFTEYLNKQIMLDVRGKPNKRNEYTYRRIYINARLEMKQVEFNDPQGNINISAGIMYTNYNIKIGDRIVYDDITYTIKQKYPCDDIFGSTTLIKCYLL